MNGVGAGSDQVQFVADQRDGHVAFGAQALQQFHDGGGRVRVEG
ncbi:hypothetical protein AB0F96_23760 [Streptomyces sp. NPDC023998]